MGQSYTNMEILLINDGSTDSSGKICREWEEKDRRITVVTKDNEGQGPCRELGIHMAQGECILFVDPDDWVEKEYVEHLTRPVLSGEAEMAVCDYRQVWCGEEDEVVRERHFKLRIPEDGVIDMHRHPEYLFPLGTLLWQKAYGKRLLQRVGAKQPPGCHEDAAVSFLYCYYAKGILPVRECLYNYRQRPGSAIHGGGLYQRVWNTLGVVRQNVLTYAPELWDTYVMKKIASDNVSCYRNVKGGTAETECLEKHFLDLFVRNPGKDAGCIKCCTFGSFNLRAMVNGMVYFPAPYYGFSSLASAMDGVLQEPCRIMHTNPFREDALRKDYGRRFQRELECVDCVFMDLLEERFPVAELSEGRLLTCSEAFDEADYCGISVKRVISSGDGVRRALTEKSILRFVDIVRQCGIKKVVLVQTRMAEWHGAYGKEEQYGNVGEIRDFNLWLEELERILAGALDNVVLVPLPEELMYTDTQFPFGCYPWHLNGCLYEVGAGMIREMLV